MQSKKEANVERAKLFVEQMLQYSGLSLAELERIICIGSQRNLAGEKDRSGSAGEALARWRDGRSKHVKMNTVQEFAKAAHDHGLLPPLREGGLRRPDIFLALDQTRDADDVWNEENKKMQRLEKLQAAAIESINEFAAAIEEDKELIVVDASINEEIEGRSCEIGEGEVRALADKLSAVRYARLNTVSDA